MLYNIDFPRVPEYNGQYKMIELIHNHFKGRITWVKMENVSNGQIVGFPLDDIKHCLGDKIAA